MRAIDLTGQRFGLLVAVRCVGVSHGSRSWECACDCGKTSITTAGRLRSGMAKSCGCRRGKFTHGQSRGGEHRELYAVWQAMIQRCTNPRSRSWHKYGGRGIGVCERWRESFEAFLSDVGPRPSPDLSIDRKDNDGNYEPGNVRWATRREQALNTRRSLKRTEQTNAA